MLSANLTGGFSQFDWCRNLINWCGICMLFFPGPPEVWWDISHAPLGYEGQFKQ